VRVKVGMTLAARSNVNSGVVFLSSVLYDIFLRFIFIKMDLKEMKRKNLLEREIIKNLEKEEKLKKKVHIKAPVDETTQIDKIVELSEREKMNKIMLHVKKLKS
jgi:hypothetical protein